MQNLEIVGIVNAYTASKGKDGVRLPAAVAWKRRVNLDKLFQAKRVIDEALREINERYSDDEHSVEENGNRKVKAEYMESFIKDQAEIMEQDTEVDVRKVKIEDLGNVELTDADMDTLAFMIEEDDLRENDE